MILSKEENKVVSHVCMDCNNANSLKHYSYCDKCHSDKLSEVKQFQHSVCNNCGVELANQKTVFLDLDNKEYCINCSDILI